MLELRKATWRKDLEDMNLPEDLQLLFENALENFFDEDESIESVLGNFRKLRIAVGDSVLIDGEKCDLVLEDFCIKLRKTEQEKGG